MAHVPKDAEWFLADLVQEIRVAGRRRNVVHVNHVIIHARSPEEADERCALESGARFRIRICMARWSPFAFAAWAICMRFTILWVMSARSCIERCLALQSEESKRWFARNEGLRYSCRYV